MLNCPQCGFRNSGNSGFCTSCGNSLTMAHFIRDEASIADLSYRMDRLEALLLELTGNASIGKQDSPEIGESTPLPRQIVSDSDTVPSQVEQSLEELTSVGSLGAVAEDAGTVQSESTTSSSSILNGIRRLDRQFGLNWLAVAGGIFIVTALGFFSMAVMAVIPPLGKFIFSLSLGTVALGLGEVSRRKYGLLSDVITGSGLSIIYIATFVAFTLGDVVPDQLGFGLLLVISFVGWFLAMRADSVWVALLGTSGTFITPFVLQGTLDVEIPILMVIAYLVIADIGVALISLTKRWVLLKQISLWSSYIFLFVVFTTESLGMPGLGSEQEPLWVGLVSFSVIYTLFLCVSTSYHLIWKVQTDFKELLLIVGNSVLFYVALLTLLSDGDTYGFGIANILLALVSASVSALFWLRGGNREIQLLFAAKSAAFGMATVPVLLNGEIVTSVWAGMAISVLVLGRYLGDVRWQLYSIILFALSLSKFWLVDIWASTDYRLFELINDRLVTGIALSGVLWMAWLACDRLRSPSPSTDGLNSLSGIVGIQNSVQAMIRSLEVRIRVLFAALEPALPRGFGTIALATGLGVGIVHLGQTPDSLPVKNLYITWNMLLVGGTAFCLAAFRRSHWFVLLGAGLLLIGVVKMAFVDVEVSRDVWVQAASVTGYFVSTFICTAALVVALLFFRRYFRQYEGPSEILLSLSKWEIRFIPAGLLVLFLGVIYLGLGMELFSQWDKAITWIFGYLHSATREMLSLVVTLLMAMVGIGTFVGSARLKDYVNVQSLYKLTAFALVMIALAKLITVDGIIVQGKGMLGNTFVPFLNVYIGTAVAMLALAAIFARISRFESWDSTKVDKDLMSLVDGIRKFGNLISLSAVAVVLLVVVSREIMVSGLHIDLERVVLSVYWLMYALAVVVLGIRWKMAKMRVIGFGLLVVPVAKTFLYDVWVINPILGFGGTFFMGCMLLGMSFVYQRNRTRIQSFLFDDGTDFNRSLS